MCDRCADQPLELGLHTTASADQLWSRWEYVGSLIDQADGTMTDALTAWRETTDPVTKNRLWAEYEAITREYRVLNAWRSLMYVAYIFSTDGAECAALDSGSPLPF